MAAINSEDNYFDSNRDLWNQKTAIHKNSEFYDLEGFKRGRNVLNEIELGELGDVSGKNLLHLQCHFGLDTMSWARMGAEVTGIDFSDKAIETAQEINEEIGLNVQFVCSNVYDLKKNLDQKFDIVFTSYGTIGWLPDIDKWAAIISHFLKTGGTFYIAEFHPVLWMFDDDFTKIIYSYFNDGVIEIDAEGTYTDRKAEIKHKEYSWNHSISDVLNALINNGLTIDFMNEHDYSPYNCFANTVKNSEGNFFIKGYERVLPMIYSIRATKS